MTYRPDDQRFLRLLEILGEYYEHGKVLVFVQSQDRADHLFRDLLRVRTCLDDAGIVVSVVV